MTTTVVNIRKVRGVTPEYDVYIGRRMPFQKLPSSIWGNPFTTQAGHTEAVKLYRSYITRRLAEEPDMRGALAALKGKRLGCWCAPLPCHGDVLAELADALEAQP